LETQTINKTKTNKLNGCKFEKYKTRQLYAYLDVHADG
jgi:hypothetical protein